MAESQAQLRAVGSKNPAGSRGKRVYSDAFKRDAVEKVRAANSISRVAIALGVSRPTLTKWMHDAAPPPMTLVEAVRSGDRRAYLVALRDDLAASIAAGMSARDKPPNIRLLNETIRELEELDARRREEDTDAASVPDDDLDPDDL